MDRNNWLNKWHVTPGSGTNYGFLDGIRGIAILLVVACHIFYINPDSVGLVKVVGSVIAAGALGVTVFFTLSGFLIAMPFWKRKLRGEDTVPPGYLMRRFWKIYPPLALSVLLLTPVYIWLKGGAGAYSVTALQWLTGIAWMVPISSRINPVMWSLIVEVHFYLLLPVCFLGLRKVGYQATLWILTAAFLILPPLIGALYANHGITSSLHPYIRVCFPVKLDSFAFGVLLAGLHGNGTLRTGWAKLAPIGFILLPITLCNGLIGDLWPESRREITGILTHYGTMLATAFLLCFIGNPSGASRWGLNSGWLRLLGLVSYEWYLFHQPLFFWSWRAFGSADGDMGKYLLIVFAPFFASLAIAALVYRYVSLPILRRTRG